MTPGEMRAFLRREWPVWLVPIVALLVVHPLLLHGPSCGHDFGFHMQSWMDAGNQIRHGVLFPRWAFSPAYNAGEPRFMFYPPLSWLFGSALLIALPPAVVPAAFTFLALTFAGWSMYALARRYAHQGGALLAAAVYVANPYMLFTAFERTAYAELLAAAWMPLLLRAALAEDPRVYAVALPIALLWLTNAPAAMMGTYTLVLVVLMRIGLAWARERKQAAPRSRVLHLAGRVAVPSAGGLLLGLALSAFYLLPAAYERRFVQIAMAIIPNMRVEDNFLFGHTGNGPHDQVLHTASLVALVLLVLTSGILLAARRRSRSATEEHSGTQQTWWLSSTLAVTIAILLLRFTLPVWRVVPELAFLQFPWRLLAVLECLLGLAVALAVGRARWRAGIVIPVSMLLAAACSALAVHPFRQGCEAYELPADRIALFLTHHGVGPTDEYTPADADNDQLRWDDPAWWLTSNPNAPGPGTVPNPAATIIDYDQPPPLEQTVSGQAPTHLHLAVKTPEDLVLNLRDYPAWVVTVNGHTPEHLQRDDGLIAFTLPVGEDDVAIHWRRLPDVVLGDGISLCAVLVAAGTGWRSRRIRP